MVQGRVSAHSPAGLPACPTGTTITRIFWAACVAVVVGSGCASPPPNQRRTLTPPVFFDAAEGKGEAFPGTSTDKIRDLIRPPIETAVTASFRSATLPTVAEELSQKSGLGIGITHEVCDAANANLINVTLHNMQAGHALEWITRLVGAYYATEGTRTVFITRDRMWASQQRLKMRSYPLGTLLRIERPLAGRYNHVQETERLLFVLRYCLRHTIRGRPDATFVLDDTAARLTAVLPPRGHAKLGRIIEEMKKPRRYESPPPNDAARERATLLAATVVCDFVRQDVLRVAEKLGSQVKVNIGFDYGKVPQNRREVTLELGETTLGKALRALARAAGLGQVVPEPGRRFWILAKDQNRRILRTTGELPWDKAVVRSYYVKRLVDQFGVGMLFNELRENVTPGEWDRDLPVAFYHRPTGRLIVIHDRPAQRGAARCIERMMNLAKAEGHRGK